MPAGTRFVRLRERWAALRAATGQAIRLETLLFLTLVMLLVTFTDSAYVSVPLIALTLLGLVYRNLLVSPRYWFVVTVLINTWNVVRWYSTDNHRFLIGYWCMAIFVALVAGNRDALKTSARLLIGLAFLFAVIWKLTSPDFLDSRFMHFSLLTDDRFHGVAATFGGIDHEMHDFNQIAYHALTSYDSQLTAVTMRSTEAAASAAHVLTWWAIAIESSIALAFLWPTDRGPSKYRDVFLVLFILSTYVVAPVISFGLVLAVMGLAQRSRGSPGIGVAYVATLLVLPAYELASRIVS